MTPLVPVLLMAKFICCVFSCFVDGYEWLLSVNSLLFYLLAMEVWK